MNAEFSILGTSFCQQQFRLKILMVSFYIGSESKDIPEVRNGYIEQDCSCLEALGNPKTTAKIGIFLGGGANPQRKQQLLPRKQYREVYFVSPLERDVVMST